MISCFLKSHQPRLGKWVYFVGLMEASAEADGNFVAFSLPFLQYELPGMKMALNGVHYFNLSVTLFIFKGAYL
jgi:hypothetical protein